MTNEQRACSDCGRKLTSEEAHYYEYHCELCERKQHAILSGDNSLAIDERRKRALELCIEYAKVGKYIQHEARRDQYEMLHKQFDDIAFKIYNLGLEAQKAGE